MITRASFFACILAFALQSTHAQVPGLMNYQGQVTDALGVSLPTGTYTMHFRIFDVPTGGTAIWGPQSFDGTAGPGKGAEVPVVDGFFNVILGSQDTTSRNLTDAFGAANRYLEIQVGANTAIAPRQQILSAPFALKASQVADGSIVTASLANGVVTGAKIGATTIAEGNLADGAVTNAKLADNAVGSAEIINGSILPADLHATVTNGLWAVSGANVYRPFGNVGIGIPNPLQALHVGGQGIFSASPAVADPGGAVGPALHIGYASTGDYGYIHAVNTGIAVRHLALQPFTTSGNVGIGLSNPGTRLDVNGNIRASGFVQVGQGQAVRFHPDGNHSAAYDATLDGPYVYGYSGGGLGVNNFGTCILTWGIYDDTQQPRVGIGLGKNRASKAALEVNGARDSRPNAGQYSQMLNNTSLFQQSAGAGGQAVSIYGSHTIWAGASVCSSSDTRIKNVEGVSDAAADLRTLRGIQVTDYRYKDVQSLGADPQKKLIAQQVETVYPQAVNQHLDVIPDLFQTADVRDGWVELFTPLRAGERVKLLDEKGQGSLHEVMVVEPGRFRVEPPPSGTRVFVYGREVNDFRTVDYDAIAMLNVSATQELARQLEVERTANSALRKELDSLRRDLSSRLTALERSVQQPVSVKP